MRQEQAADGAFSFSRVDRGLACKHDLTSVSTVCWRCSFMFLVLLLCFLPSNQISDMR